MCPVLDVAFCSIDLRSDYELSHQRLQGVRAMSVCQLVRPSDFGSPPGITSTSCPIMVLRTHIISSDPKLKPMPKFSSYQLKSNGEYRDLQLLKKTEYSKISRSNIFEISDTKVDSDNVDVDAGSTVSHFPTTNKTFSKNNVQSHLHSCPLKAQNKVANCKKKHANCKSQKRPISLSINVQGWPLLTAMR